MIHRVQQYKFIQDRYKGYGKTTMVILWIVSMRCNQQTKLEICIINLLYVWTLNLGDVFFQRSFFKQFYGSVTKDDYVAMRLGFLMVCHTRFHNFIVALIQLCLFFSSGPSCWTTIFTWQEHFRGNRKFDFYDYMIKALEKDYKRVVGIK
jgi:mlo protein